MKTKIRFAVSGIIVLGLFSLIWGLAWIVNGFVTQNYFYSLLMVMPSIVAMLLAMQLTRYVCDNRNRGKNNASKQ